jgi:hypothetical protein
MRMIAARREEMAGGSVVAFPSHCLGTITMMRLRLAKERKKEESGEKKVLSPVASEIWV